MCCVLAAEPHDSVDGDALATRIRPASAADVGPLAILMAEEARLQEQGGGYALKPDFDWAAWLEARLGSAGQFVYLAEQGHRPIGFIYARLRTPPPPRSLGLTRRTVRALLRRPAPSAAASFHGWGLIESLFVMASARRRGVARRLVAAVQDDFGRQAVERIEISVMAGNEPALNLWASLGFAPFREHRVKVLAPPSGPGAQVLSSPSTDHAIDR